MEIFYQLLDSYALIKKRKFHVLREGQFSTATPESRANAAAGNAINFTKDQPYQPIPDKSVYVFKTTKGRINYGIGNPGNYGSQGVVFEPNGAVGGGWEKFVSFFKDEETGDDTVQTQQAQQMAPGERSGLPVRPVMFNDSSKSYLNIDGHARDLYEDVTISESFKELDEGLKERLLFNHVNFLNFFTGGLGQSFQSKLENLKSIKFVDGKIVLTGALEDAELLAAQTATRETFEDMMSRLNQDTLDDADKAWFKETIFIGDGKIGIRPRGFSKEDGITIDDKKGVLAATILSKVDKKDVGEYVSALDKSAFRGTNLEMVMIPINLQANCERRQKIEKDNPNIDQDQPGHTKITLDLCKLAVDSWGDFRNEVSSMMESHTEWVTDYQRGLFATQTSEEAVFQSISLALGLAPGQEESMLQIIRGMITTSKDSWKTRQPDFMVRVGSDTGGGEKNDVREIWIPDDEGCNRANTNIGGGFQADTMSLEDAFAGDTKQEGTNNAMLEIARNMMPTDQTEVCVAGVSIKNYLSLAKKDPKFGENFVNRLGSLIQCATGGDCEIKDADASAGLVIMMNKVPEKLGMDAPEFFAGVTGYDGHFKSMEAQVTGLTSNAEVLDPETGKVISYNPIDATVTTFLDSIKQNATYEELYGDEASRDELKSGIERKLTELREKGTIAGSIDTVDEVKATKRAIMSYLVNKKRERDINAEAAESPPRIGPATKHALAQAMAVGASNDDQALFDTRGLLDGTQHTSFQNDYLYEIMDGLQSATPRWRVEATGATIKFINIDDPRKFAKLGNQSRSRGSGGLGSIQSEFSVSDDFLASLSLQTRSLAPQSLNASIQSFLDTQKVLLEDLLSTVGQKSIHPPLSTTPPESR